MSRKLAVSEDLGFADLDGQPVLVVIATAEGDDVDVCCLACLGRGPFRWPPGRDGSRKSRGRHTCGPVAAYLFEVRALKASVSDVTKAGVMQDDRPRHLGVSALAPLAYPRSCETEAAATRGAESANLPTWCSHLPRPMTPSRSRRQPLVRSMPP